MKPADHFPFESFFFFLIIAFFKLCRREFLIGESGGCCETSLFSSPVLSAGLFLFLLRHTKNGPNLPSASDPLQPVSSAVGGVARVLRLLKTSLAFFSLPLISSFFSFCVRTVRRPCDPSHPPSLSGNGKADRREEEEKKKEGECRGLSSFHHLSNAHA